MTENEKIVCSAIVFQDGKKYPHNPINIQRGYVIYGLRHHQCFSINKLIDKTQKYNNIQGFITNTNRFVNRSDAAKIAYNAGQINEEKDWLYSEDLY